MESDRVSLSQPDRRHIIGRSGGCCNKCRVQVFKENEFGERARLGDDAHIWAYSEDGPRGNESDAPSDRNDLRNIILLCKNCHAEGDQQPRKFSTSALTNLREAHYAWIDDCLGQSAVQKPRFHYLLYLNAPRLDMYAVMNSIPLPSFKPEGARRFRDLGFEAGRVMASYTRVLNLEDLYAHRVQPQDDISNLSAGHYCFIEPCNFRTVAINSSANLEAAWNSGKSIIYRRYDEWKLVCLIDPKWITTSTAGSTLQSGQAQLCGVVRINRVDEAERKIVASPLFLAQPEGPFLA